MQARGIGQRDRLRFLLRRPEFSFMRSRKHALARLRATVMRAIVIEERFCARMFSFVLFACERAFLDVRKVSSETLFKLFLFMGLSAAATASNTHREITYLAVKDARVRALDFCLGQFFAVLP